ncbi:Uncharacterised protein [Orientia tsutsugamushi]|uniref:Tetrapyrrole biosynthesis uroporphyrinogen III synthase domain-containing protein n=2 Tax=Orientia tsutsugamushi TaxID=784 RepID=B3CR59_ORITI|nr:hypothetical protein [Orientia tsutsugamushi]KJV75229.1 hypothetical protein OTSTA763_0644 [Orientia tsutsugamushi str. TA763]KJV76883.1 hypothetical protein OTSTA716_0561 [Orientia tsutsugamushi str. TA716]BAG39966.1 hypothetical protein OTT_0508 [Orientia tsutsugamushi str. Ikeda]SPP24037.1 Uncharacterised protein [Orientia tsutsugamushi]
MALNKLLLIRTIEENKLLQSRLVGKFTICNCPLINYEVIKSDYSKISQGQNIVITSKFAAKIIAENMNSNVNCFVVGQVSSQILQQNKFIRVVGVYNTVEKLLLNISEVKNIIYYCGNYITHDPPNHWTKKIVYLVKYAQDLTDEAKINLSLSQISHSLIYSYNAGLNLIKLLKKNKLLWTLQNVRIICISSKVGSLFTKIAKKVSFPTTPTSKNMIKILLNHNHTI